MNENLLRGELVYLAHMEPAEIAKAQSDWMLSSEFSRLEDWDPARMISSKTIQKWVEKQNDNPEDCSFVIRLIENDRFIGGIGMNYITWPHGDCSVGIGIGNKEDWGKGYGTDAMKIMLRYAFTELNLRRVSLDVFEYNPRGIRSYEKAGFVVEGRVRGQLLREGRRWDDVYMGILKEEWIKLQEQQGVKWTQN